MDNQALTHFTVRNWKEIVERAQGKEALARDVAYEFSGKRKFNSTDAFAQGIYEPHPDTYSVFTPASIARLKANYANVGAATTLINAVRAYALTTLGYSPHPKAVMDIEGNLSSSDEALVNTDFDILISCGVQYQFTGQTAYADHAIQYLLAWSSTYIPIGNPITEEVFYKFVAGYDLVQDAVTDRQKSAIDEFLIKLFTTAQTFMSLRDATLSHSNFESRGLMLITAIAYNLNDEAKKTICRTLYESQIDLNILKVGTIATSIPYVVTVPALAARLNEAVRAGSTFDYVQRDAVLYHVSSIGGLLFAALVAKNNGATWSSFTSAQGKKLSDGIDFTSPFASGSETHIDFTNSIVQPFDAGRVGAFDPVNGKNLINLAAMVIPSYAGSYSVSTLPTWQQVLYYSAL